MKRFAGDFGGAGLFIVSSGRSLCGRVGRPAESSRPCRNWLRRKSVMRAEKYKEAIPLLEKVDRGATAKCECSDSPRPASQRKSDDLKGASLANYKKAACWSVGPGRRFEYIGELYTGARTTLRMRRNTWRRLDQLVLLSAASN